MLIMMCRLLSVAFAIVAGFALPGFAAEKVQPVRMGDGIMTFDTVPGWGLDENGKSVLGGTHGGVVIDKAGNIYTSSSLGVFIRVGGAVVVAFVDASAPPVNAAAGVCGFVPASVPVANYTLACGAVGVTAP